MLWQGTSCPRGRVKGAWKSRLLRWAFGLLLLVVLLLKFVAPPEIRRQLREAVRANCAKCELEMRSVSLSLIPLVLSAEGVRFRGGDVRTTEVWAEIGSIRMVVNPGWLLDGTLHLSEMRVTHPEVTVTEGDLPTPESGSAAPNRTQWDFALEHLRIEDGEFTYQRRHGDARSGARDARLAIHGLDGDVSALGTAPRLRDQRVEARLHGRLEQSGDVKLVVRAVLFQDRPDAELELHLRRQKLAELNPYLEAAEGIRLQGMVREAHAVARVKGDSAAATVRALYEGLAVDVESTDQRSGLAAFFTQLVASVKLDSGNRGADRPDQTGHAEAQRKPRESLVAFVLRALREAALEVASAA
jgi:hypothetical protein